MLQRRWSCVCLMCISMMDRTSRGNLRNLSCGISLFSTWLLDIQDMPTLMSCIRMSNESSRPAQHSQSKKVKGKGRLDCRVYGCIEFCRQRLGCFPSRLRPKRAGCSRCVARSERLECARRTVHTARVTKAYVYYADQYGAR